MRPPRPKSLAPIKVRRGSAIVTVYQEFTHLAGKKYPSFRVRWFDTDDHRAKPRRFPNKPDALAFAESKAVQIANGQGAALKFSDADVNSAVRCRQILEQSGIKKPVELVMAEYAEFTSALGDRRSSLNEAVRFYLKHHPKNAGRKTFPEIVALFNDVKKRDGARWRHRRDLKNRLAIFTAIFSGPLTDYTAADFNGALDDLQKKHDWKNRSRNHHRVSLLNCINWARGEKHIPREWDEDKYIRRFQEKDGPITVYTPEETKKFFTVAGDDMLPALALMFFSACRTSEVIGNHRDNVPPLDWSDINFKTGEIFVNEGKVRTSGQRFAHLPPNAREWLKPFRKEHGRIYHAGHQSFMRKLSRLAAAVGIKWKHNAHRHSGISYRMALIRDIERVSDEVGTAITTLRKRYRRPMPKLTAKKYFSIVPATGRSKVIALRKKRFPKTFPKRTKNMAGMRTKTRD